MTAKSSARFLLAMAALAALATCERPFGPRANIHDPQGTWVIPSWGRSPADGATTFDTTPLLVWQPVSGAARYDVAMAVGGADLSAATPAAATESQYQVPPDSIFIDGDVVRWRARAVNGDGVGGPWSSTHQFTVSLTVNYGTPSPEDGAAIYDTIPLLDWGDVGGAASYEVEVADSAAGLDAATPVAVSESEYQVPAVLAYGTWYWRVRAVNDDEVAADWSTTWSFELPEPLLDMVSVSGGTFSMGSTSGESDETPVHDVTVSSFLISKYEVTQADYQTVIGSNPSYFTGDTSRPVEQVSWYDAVAFCNALSALESLEACYVINGDSTTCDFTKNGYRLPTEAEWEFAARGGTESLGYTCSGSNTADDVAWYDDNAGSTTHAVGTKAANELGIYDMSGNVWEWCWDWHGSYSSGAQSDPTGPTTGSGRVERGGNYDYSASGVRSARRAGYRPGTMYNGGSGFRVVLRAGS